MKTVDPLDRGHRIIGRIVGWLFHLVGIFFWTLLVLDYRHVDGALAIVGMGLLFFALGIPFSGLGAGVRRRWREARTRRLVRSLSRSLGSAVALEREIGQIRWSGIREGARIVVSWSCDSPITQVAVEIPKGSPGTLRIVPTWRRGGRLLGGRSMSTGHPEFDLHFLARSEPPGLLNDLFSEDRRDLLARSLFGLPGGTSSRVVLTLTDLRIRVPRLVADDPGLKRLFNAAETFAWAIHETIRQAVYAILTVGVGSDARCPVCISTLESEVVLCLKCRTPHHESCWEYTGECALFACGGRRFIPA